MTDNHKAKSGQKTRNGQNTIYRDEATVAKKKKKEKKQLGKRQDSRKQTGSYTRKNTRNAPHKDTENLTRIH